MAVATRSIRSRLFRPQTPSPFDLPAQRDPAADTLVDQANVDTVFADQGWKNATLNRLSDAEDFLDCLEANGVAEREFEVRGNSSYCVRWR
jgi:hypothetical protein